jgi:bleomycin hydrolase
VRTHGTNRFSDGGLSHDVLHVVRAHGVVPRDCYTGLLDEAETHDHRELFPVVNGLVSGVIAAGGVTPLGARWSDGQFEARWINALCGTLDAYLGAPPATFEDGGRQFTPRQFADEVLRLPLDDYVEITSYSQLPFFGSGELLIPDNWLHQPYYNVPLDDFMRIIDHALANGFSLVCSLHATQEEFRSRCTYLLALDEGTDTHTTQDQRDTLFDSWRVEDVHAVHVVGLTKDEAGRTFYLTKDSDTPASEENSDGYNKDYLSLEFVRSRVLLVMVHQDGIPADIRARLGLGGN